MVNVPYYSYYSGSTWFHYPLSVSSVIVQERKGRVGT